jgi:hypothetical protein
LQWLGTASEDHYTLSTSICQFYHLKWEKVARHSVDYAEPAIAASAQYFSGSSPIPKECLRLRARPIFDFFGSRPRLLRFTFGLSCA